MSRKREPESSIVGLVDADENLDMLDFDEDKDVDADYIEADIGTDDIGDIIASNKLGIKSEDFYMSDDSREEEEFSTNTISGTTAACFFNKSHFL